VADEDIIADYALSQAAMVRMLEWLRVEQSDRPEELDRLWGAIVAADPETMALFLEQFRLDHGTFESFAASLGVASAVRHVRAALLEP
jgi:hypothetical protein